MLQFHRGRGRSGGVRHSRLAAAHGRSFGLFDPADREALGGSIASDSLRDAVADAIDPALRVGLRAGAGRSPVHVDELYSRIADASGLPPGIAIEVVQMHFGWLAQRLRPDLLQSLREELGREWSSLLVEPAPAAPETATHRSALPIPGSGHTLSTRSGCAAA